MGSWFWPTRISFALRQQNPLGKNSFVTKILGGGFRIYGVRITISMVIKQNIMAGVTYIEQQSAETLMVSLTMQNNFLTISCWCKIERNCIWTRKQTMIVIMHHVSFLRTAIYICTKQSVSATLFSVYLQNTSRYYAYDAWKCFSLECLMVSKHLSKVFQKQ